jgi:hypothetical protein
VFVNFGEELLAAISASSMNTNEDLCKYSVARVKGETCNLVMQPRRLFSG